MFGIGSWEFLIIAGLALLLFGPDKLPDLARTAGRFMRDFRRYQSMMESTIKMEVLASDPKLQKDPFKTGKDFAEKVGSGKFTRPADPQPKPSETEAEAEQTDADAIPPAETEADAVAVDPVESGEGDSEQA